MEKYYELDWFEISDRVRQIVTDMQTSVWDKFLSMEEDSRLKTSEHERLTRDLNEIHNAVFLVGRNKANPFKKQVDSRNNVFYEFMREAAELK